MGWDKGVDYETVYSLIVRHMKRTKKETQKCYDSILLTQLRNGSRISEAVRAYILFLKTKNTELEVRVSKKKREETRLMVIPPEVITCPELMMVSEKKLVNRIKFYIKSVYRLNTHSLRYAFITHLLRNGVNPSIVAKITRHARLDYILTYTQSKVAEEILRNLP